MTGVGGKGWMSETRSFGSGKGRVDMVAYWGAKSAQFNFGGD